MKYLLGLILLISVSATAQYSPTAAKTRFVNGIGLGTKDTATMNAADTVAMIVGRDSLVYFRYRGYWKPLAYNSSLTGYVPYTGATSSVNLGSYNLTANKIAIGGSISAVALDVHRAGSIIARIENTNASQDALFAYAQSAQNVWFTGIDYSSGANNFGFYYTPDGTTVLRKAYFSNAGDLTANSFIKSGGTSSQFLKADGSVDANAYTKISDTASMLSPYALDYNVVHKNGNETINGLKTFTSYLRTVTSGSTGLQAYNSDRGYFIGMITSSTDSLFVINYDSGYNQAKTRIIQAKKTGEVSIPNLSTAGIVTNTSAGQLGTSNGTGFIKMSGGAVSYDNSSYVPTSAISGTTNYIPKFTSSSAIGNSLIYDNGTNIGINTSNPSVSLEVSGDIMAGTNNKIGFRYSPTNNNFYSYITANGVNPLTLVGGLWTSLTTNESIRFSTYYGTAVSILNNFNVGINNSTPSYLLDVNGNARFIDDIILGNGNSKKIYGGVIGSTSYIELYNGSTGDMTFFGNYSTGAINFCTNNNLTPKLKILSTGVINTSSRLNVNGATDDGSTALNVTGNGKISSRLNVNGPTDNPSYQLNVAGSINASGSTFARQSSIVTIADESGILNILTATAGWSSRVDYSVAGVTRWAVGANAAVGGGAGINDFEFYNGSLGTSSLTIKYATGAATFSSLAGTGSRIVVADASGTLSATTAAATSGTYTPTITLVSNAASSTARVCQYMRVGSVVTVSGYVTVTATTPAVSSRIYMTLPISSSFTSTAQAGGAGGVPGGANIGTVIFANSTATTVSMDFLPVAGATDYWFSYTYQIL